MAVAGSPALLRAGGLAAVAFLFLADVERDAVADVGDLLQQPAAGLADADAVDADAPERVHALEVRDQPVGLVVGTPVDHLGRALRLGAVLGVDDRLALVVVAVLLAE